MEQTTISLISLFPENKQQIKAFSENVINYVVSGETSALKTDYILKCMEESIKVIREGIKNEVVSEAEIESPSGKSFEYMGAKSIQVISRSTWDYSKCNLYNELKAKENVIKEQVKRVEKIMQVIETDMADTETGEILTPATKMSTKSIVYKL